ncbi:hypothetical protein [Domibacillus robiginosus]|uniref:hypothetical protein n=1 Tax=Domibacillus robiginosus TaxID=1071054 RepID=UPI00067CA346|nr:hypothetical protein [Domibacillus robiginosus]
MCFSNNVFEQQALEMAEQIQKKSIYKFVGANFLGSRRLEFHEQSSNVNDYKDTLGNGTALITEVILEDSDGNQYSIEPNPNGLRFAKGEITYKEYENLEINGNKQGLRLVFITTSIYLLIGGTFIWYLY